MNSAASGGSNATCLVDVRFNAAMKSKRPMHRPAAKKRRSAGTKKNPTCSICSSDKHYGSSCPVLAQQLLKAVRRKSGLQNIVQTLAQRDVVSLVEAPPKPRRTLKRRSRGNKFALKKAKQAGSKRKRKKNSRKVNTVRDADRRPRAMKTCASQKVKTSETKKAYHGLLKSGWLWKPPRCGCGGCFELQSAQTCASRGKGRLFYRCDDCRGPRMFSWKV